MRFALFFSSRTRAYWLLQIVGWTLVIGVLLTLYWPYVQVQTRFSHFALDMVLAFASTFALHAVGRRVWNIGQHRISGGICCVGLGLLSGFGVEATSELIARLTWEPSEHITLLTLFAESVDYALLLGAWCVFYLGVKSYLEANRTEQCVRDAQLLARDAQLRALRSQLQPHFLFNALNSVSSLAVAGYKKEAVSMLGRLNDLLCAMLDTEEHYLTDLATELYHAQQYLSVQQLRFGDRLKIEFDIQPGLEAVMVPRWVLLPLIENAVLYGLSAPGVDTPLRLRIRRNQNALLVTMENRTCEESEAIQSRGFGIGLRNTRTLLQTIYGDLASLSVNNSDGLFVLKLSLPISSKFIP